MNGRLWKFLKRLLIAFLIWLCLTGVLVVVDNSFGASQKFALFSVVAVVLPIFLAAFYIARGVYKAPKEREFKHQSSPQKVDTSKPIIEKAASSEPPTQEFTFPLTGNSQLDAAMAVVDAMDGLDFERFCAELLERCRYRNIHITKGSGDQGVDIIAIKGGIRYAFQCKRYSSKLGNTPVQEVYTGKQFYSCQVGVVITNSYFTQGAVDAARRVEVELWDRDTLIRKMGYRVSTGKSATR